MNKCIFMYLYQFISINMMTSCFEYEDRTPVLTNMLVALTLTQPASHTFTYSITPFIRINWDGETSGFAENPDNWIFCCEHRLHWQFAVRLLLFTVRKIGRASCRERVSVRV
jgi:hypothetical protein